MNIKGLLLTTALLSPCAALAQSPATSTMPGYVICGTGVTCSATGLLTAAGGVAIGTTSGTARDAALAIAAETSKVALDDPTGSIYGLGPNAVLRGQVNILQLSGVTYGSGQSTAVRQSNATALQAAFTAANTYGLELACPATARIEINNTAGEVVPTAGVGFRARLSQTCAIVQYGTNAPILTIADPAGGSYKYDVDWDGGDFEYGVSQTGNTNSIAVLLGACAYCKITGLNANSQSASPPAYVALQLGNSNNSGGSRFFSNTLGRINAGNSQYANFANFFGGTGNSWTDVYLQNGSNAGSAQPLSQAAFFVAPTSGAQAGGDTWTRLNVEHGQGAAALSFQGAVNNEFISLHIEDFALNAYGPQFFYVVNSDVHFTSLDMLDVKTISGSGGTIAVFRENYGSHIGLDGQTKIKWSGSPTNEITNSGMLFFEGASGTVNADDLVNFRTSSVAIEDDSGTNATKVQLDPIITTPLSILQYWGSYQYDKLFPTTDHAIFTIPASTTAFTLLGAHNNATVVLGTGETAARTVTLSNVRKTSGTGSSVATPSAQVATINWAGGTHAFAATISNGASGAITTIPTSVTTSTPYAFVQNGTNFVAAP